MKLLEDSLFTRKVFFMVKIAIVICIIMMTMIPACTGSLSGMLKYADSERSFDSTGKLDFESDARQSQQK